jgi:hypothetical protein
VGRQSGKTRIAAAIATFEAISAEREPGSDLFAVLVAQDQRAALRTSFRYASAPFEASAILKRSIVSQTADALGLETGVTLAAYPCRPASVRGLRARGVVVDELAFFISTDGRPTDTEMLRALGSLPCDHERKADRALVALCSDGRPLRPAQGPFRRRQLVDAGLAGERPGDEPDASSKLHRTDART